VGNPSALTAALTAAQLDAAYLAAINATKGSSNNTTKKIGGVVSARQSDVIRSAIKNNAQDASANGHNDRRGFICSPNGTGASTIISNSPSGVGTYREEGTSFAAGGVKCFLQEMIDGGYPVDPVARTFVRHPDAILASRYSVLPPGYNPGQWPENPLFQLSPSVFVGLEDSALSWDIDTYAAFKAAGVCAAEFDSDTGIVFEQGVTTVDPAVEPNRKTIARRALAGFIGDSVSAFARPKAKRQGTETRRELLKDAISSFLDGLMAPNGDTVKEYSVSISTDGLPAGVVEYPIQVKMEQSDDVFLLNLSVGTNVTVKVQDG
jgi:hypothetical protein